MSAVLLVCAQFILGCQPRITEIPYIYENDSQMWEHLFSATPEVSFTKKPRGLILPHHMIVGEHLAQTYKGLSKIINPDVVVIIGPNHYQDGQANIQTCQTCLFKTIDGNLSLNNELTQKIIDEEIATVNDQAFLKEHAIQNHTPFIKKFLPNAEIIPIILKWETTQEEAGNLADWLSNNLPENSIVIASVDFSHYISAQAATFHDIASHTTINNFDLDNVYDLEIDSPASISTILYLMQKQGNQEVERLKHTNNQDYRSTILDSTTSHQFIAFYEGAKEIKKNLTILVAGNIPDDPEIKKNLTIFDSFRWDINATEPNFTINPNLSEIRGQEDRFLVGTDFLIFDLPQENECINKKQNGLQIAFCSFTQAKNSEEEKQQIETIRNQKSSGADYVYVQYEFKAQEFSSKLQNIARKFTSSGTDIFIGKGLENILPIEKNDNSVIAYSLGDFITTTSTQSSSGTILGISLSAESMETFEFPIEIKNGKPTLILSETQSTEHQNFDF